MGGAFEPAGGHAELIPPRVAAFRILEDVEKGAYADRSAERRLASAKGADRALALELAYGCIRLRARLDTELARLAERPLRSLDRAVLLWLRLGLYQLRETRVPDHAAVHEAVQGLRRCGVARAAGFVNAVLRAAARLDPEERLALFPPLEADPVGHLTSWGSHPEWLVRRWLDRWPLETVARLVELDNTPPSVTLRTLGEEAARAAAEAREGVYGLAPVPGFPGSWELCRGDPSGPLGDLPAVVQDPAASAVVEYVGPAAGRPLVDLCAAPGGKAVALAAGEAAGPVVAADRSTVRIRKVAETGGALGADLLLLVADGRMPPLRSAGTILLDAPCLGTGVLRRRPDARWRVGPERLAAVVRLQRQLLDAAADLAEPGGTIVYATCTLEPEENEGQVTDFLSRHPDFSRGPAPGGWAFPEDLLGPEGELRVWPWQHSTDGSFAVRLRRSA